ncbi:MAG: hypothetical protein JNJ45_12660 [Chthonomonas sp.]|nr:hypothetical protein [Chthonomonas sp.]
MKLATSLALSSLCFAAFAQTLFQTGFEQSDGYNPGPLAGQDGWSDNTSTGEVIAGFSNMGLQSALIPIDEVGLAGSLWPQVSFNPFQATNKWLRLEWSQFARLTNRQVNSANATTIGFEIRSGGQLIAGVKVAGGTDTVCVYNRVSGTYMATEAVAPREGWVNFAIQLDAINGRATYSVDQAVVSADVPAGIATGELDAFQFVLSDTGFEHLYVDDVKWQAVPQRTVVMRTNSTSAANLEQVEHLIKFQQPSDGTVVQITNVTPTAFTPMTVVAPNTSAQLCMRVKPRGHLSRLVKNFYSWSTANQALTDVFVAGDITSDDIIDVGDYSELAFDFDKNALSLDWFTPRANGVRPCDSDLTRDGVVDISDYDVLVFAFDLTGDLP